MHNANHSDRPATGDSVKGAVASLDAAIAAMAQDRPDDTCSASAEVSKGLFPAQKIITATGRFFGLSTEAAPRAAGKLRGRSSP